MLVKQPPTALATGSKVVWMRATQIFIVQTNKALKSLLRPSVPLVYDYHFNYPSDVEEDNVQDAKGRSGEPDGEEGDEREGDTPDEGQWQSEQGGQQAINPVAGTGEKNVR